MAPKVGKYGDQDQRINPVEDMCVEAQQQQKGGGMELTQRELEGKIRRSRNFAVGLFLLVVAAYLIWFALLNHGEASLDPAVWGQLGDYVGGILNPLIAFLAFYWLTQSVLLQRQELQDTKAALHASAEAQGKQEKYAQRSARVAALTAIVMSHNSDVSGLRSEISRLNQLPLGQPGRFNGKRLKDADVPEKVAELTRMLNESIGKRDRAIAEIELEMVAINDIDG